MRATLKNWRLVLWTCIRGSECTGGQGWSHACMQHPSTMVAGHFSTLADMVYMRQLALLHNLLERKVARSKLHR